MFVGQQLISCPFLEMLGLSLIPAGPFPPCKCVLVRDFLSCMYDEEKNLYVFIKSPNDVQIVDDSSLGKFSIQTTSK